MEKMTWDGPKWSQGDFFPINPDLADILGRMDLNFEICFFVYLFDPTMLDFAGPQISKVPDFQVPRFPDAAGAGAAGRILRSQLDPSPNAPRDQIYRKGPCCNLFSHDGLLLQGRTVLCTTALQSDQTTLPK